MFFQGLQSFGEPNRRKPPGFGGIKVITISANDPNGDTIEYIVITPPAHGTLASFDSATGEFNYSANAGYSGLDSFKYLAFDGVASSPVQTVTAVVNRLSQALYETDFPTDVSTDWSMTNMSVDVGSGILVDTGWGRVGPAELTGSKAIDVADVAINATATVITGHPNGYVEIAGRTSAADDGVFLRAYAGWAHTRLELWDDFTLLDSRDVLGVRPSFSMFQISLALSGNSAQVIIHQDAGTNGSQSWGGLLKMFFRLFLGYPEFFANSR